MPQRRDSTSWSSPLADGGLWLVALLAPLAVGGVYPATQLVLAGLICLIALATLWHARVRQRHLRVPLLALLPLAMAALCALQLLPLPPALTALLSPRAATIFTATLVPLGLDGWHGLSLDPPGTWHELGKLTSWGLLLVVATDRAGQPHGTRRLLKAVAVAGLAVLLVTLVQTLAQVPRPYGIFGHRSHGFLVTPFVNSNHAAGFFGVTACAAAAVAAEHRDRSRAAIWGILAVGLAAAVPVTLSRGGVLALLATALLAGWLLYARARERLASMWVLHAGVGLAMAVAGYLAFGPISRELATLLPDAGGYDKAELWRDVPDMIAVFWLTGSGRGAFSRAFSGYSTHPINVTFEYAENAPLQLLADFGLPLGLALLAALALVLVLALQRTQRRAGVAVASGLFFLAVHNLVDFNIEIPGVAIPALLLVATVLAQHPGRRRAPATRPRPALPMPLSLGLALGLGALSLGAIGYGSGREDRDLDATLASTRDPVLLGRLAANGLRRHPADSGYAYALGQAHRQRDQPERALRWINRSLLLNPTYPHAYRSAAQLLWQRGAHAQALENWRQTVTLRGGLARKVAADLLHTGARYSELAAGLHPDHHFQFCIALHRRDRDAEADSCLQDLLRAQPEHRDGLATATRWAMQRADFDLARRMLEKLLAAHPHEVTGHLIRGQLAQRQGQIDKALQHWSEGARQVEIPGPLHRARFRLLLAQKRYTEARKALDALRAGGRGVRSAAQGHLLAGNLYRVQGQLAKALREYRAAVSLAPATPKYRMILAATYERLAQPSRALEVYRELLRAQPEHAGARKAEQRILAAQAEANAAREQEALYGPGAQPP